MTSIGDHPDGHLDALAWVAALLMLAFALLAIAVGTGRTAGFDTWIAHRLEQSPRTLVFHVMEGVIQAGSLPITGVAALVGLVLAGLRRSRSWLILLAPLATVPIELLAKNVIPRTMFENSSGIQIGSLLTIATPYTFPSGNTARVAALVVALLLHPAMGRTMRSGTKTPIVAVSLSLAALTLTVWSHLVIGDHWASDVLGGLILGAAVAFALGWMTQGHGVSTPAEWGA